MRLASIKTEGEEIAGIVTARGILPVRDVNARTGMVWEREGKYHGHTGRTGTGH